MDLGKQARTSYAQPLKILIAASGTGGHLLPAVAIAKGIERANSSVNILFVGSGRELERKIIVEQNGYSLSTIKTSGVSRLGLKGLYAWMKGFPGLYRATNKLLKDFKPDVVIGVGGYASFAPVFFSWLKKIPTLIHEAEKTPGLANKILSYFANIVSVAHANARFPKIAHLVHTGQPLKRDFYEFDFKKELPKLPRNFLILGGSQGAQSIDDACAENASFFKEHNIAIKHQARKDNVEKLVRTYQDKGVEAEVFSFTADMKPYYMWSDLIVSRTGASASLEIELVGRPAILVPLPGAQEQMANGERLKSLGLALVTYEREQRIPDLMQQMNWVLAQQNYSSLQAGILENKLADPTDQIAQLVFSVVKN
jgi:UDP-N-acetylglucosamine--N-acetylmuramyl-(pentapeptide) pyrophosphoryl-undecaprenol N-acetylglucosamine transferase